METVFGLAGGLAVFLFGMNTMSESQQKAAGAKMKSILSMLTSNPVLGVLAGAVATAVLQSSSATTGHGHRLRQRAPHDALRQAIAVIFGANIGTTMTAQLMAFKISDYIWLIVFVGFIVWFVKDERIKNIGQTVFAFGLLLWDRYDGRGHEAARAKRRVPGAHRPGEGHPRARRGGGHRDDARRKARAPPSRCCRAASQPGPDGVTSVLGLQGRHPHPAGRQHRHHHHGAVGLYRGNRAMRSARPWRTACSTSRARSCSSGSCPHRAVRAVPHARPDLDVIARQIANAHTTFNVVCTLLWLPLIGADGEDRDVLVPGKAGGRRTPPSSPSTTRSSASRCSPSGCSARSCSGTADKVRAMLGALPGAIANRTPPRSRRSG